MRGRLSACPHRQAGPEKPEAYSLEYVEDLSGPRTKQMPGHPSPQ